MNDAVVPFTKEDVMLYLDLAIMRWRLRRDNDGSEIAEYYIDAYQSVRTSLFGETLSADESGTVL